MPPGRLLGRFLRPRPRSGRQNRKGRHDRRQHLLRKLPATAGKPPSQPRLSGADRIRQQGKPLHSRTRRPVRKVTFPAPAATRAFSVAGGAYTSAQHVTLLTPLRAQPSTTPSTAPRRTQVRPPTPARSPSASPQPSRPLPPQTASHQRGRQGDLHHHAANAYRLLESLSANGLHRKPRSPSRQL